ncbi:hypothetical protein BMETH_593_0 [methanotrophic bacterial endosymbiont of Bathymodiolus sp.]|nr:hypothetical protein BMETH_593_0 [methanotrophic bacterial endosymbiont of Bathymodiolus sp.]
MFSCRDNTRLFIYRDTFYCAAITRIFSIAYFYDN